MARINKNAAAKPPKPTMSQRHACPYRHETLRLGLNNYFYYISNLGVSISEYKNL